MAKIRYSIVAPCYNEEGNLPELHRRLAEVMDQTDESWELVLINDGSVDRTAALMEELHRSDPRVHYLDFARNFGHQIAVTAGVDYAQGEAVIIIDADLQDPPELILKMIDKWKDGYHVIYAVRAERKGESWFKLFTAKLFYRIIYRITDVDIPLDTGDFRLMDRKVVDALKQMKEYGLLGKNVLALEVPCFKALDPVHVINALKCGFNGVMAAVCSAEDCKLEKGRDIAERNLDVLKDVLKKMNLLHRFEYYEASPRCADEFKEKLDAFHKKIAAMPQCAVIVTEASGKRTK